MIQTLIGPVIGLIGKAIDKAVPDKAEAERLKAQVTLAAMQQADTELKGAVEVILAEAKGESWLQRNWRPTTMLTFTGLVVAHWLGFTAENLSEPQILALLDIVQIGIGGYILGRSGEKMVKAYKN